LLSLNSSQKQYGIFPFKKIRAKKEGDNINNNYSDRKEKPLNITIAIHIQETEADQVHDKNIHNTYTQAT
jgi:hypothetical protein